MTPVFFEKGATWLNQKKTARALPSKELARHAAVSADNRHRCKDCFCCAALTVLEERNDQALLKKYLAE